MGETNDTNETSTAATPREGTEKREPRPGSRAARFQRGGSAPIEPASPEQVAATFDNASAETPVTGADNPSLVVSHLSKSFDVDGEQVPVLDDVSLTVGAGEFVTIVGHSGCGKSTLLKIVSGLTGFTEGSITRNGKSVTGPDTDCGMVFQEHRLLPWLKISDNVGFGLDKHDRQTWQHTVDEYIKLVHLDGFENVYPSQLSGGMSQRAAIARGLVTHPRLLLLDEPLGALDALTRVEMQKELLRIWREEHTTMLLVTHDIDEAIYLGQRVVVMGARPGRIEEVIRIESPNAKVRGSADFNYYKQRIYRHFFKESEVSPEYSI